jgi:hypothetical protein
VLTNGSGSVRNYDVGAEQGLSSLGEEVARCVSRWCSFPWSALRFSLSRRHAARAQPLPEVTPRAEPTPATRHPRGAPPRGVIRITTPGPTPSEPRASPSPLPRARPSRRPATGQAGGWHQRRRADDHRPHADLALARDPVCHRRLRLHRGWMRPLHRRVGHRERDPHPRRPERPPVRDTLRDLRRLHERGPRVSRGPGDLLDDERDPLQLPEHGVAGGRRLGRHPVRAQRRRTGGQALSPTA